MFAKLILSSIIASALSCAPNIEVFAYEGGPVLNGGTIAGQVKFKGGAPHPKTLQISKDAEVCGRTAKFDPALVVTNGAVANAVVFLSDIQKGKTQNIEHVTLDQRGCEYHPHVLAFAAGSTVDVLNPDGILHNIHSYSHVNSVFNYAQPKFRKSLSVKIEKPEIINIKCDVHDWMNGSWFAASNPYYSVTGGDGMFKLTDVPAGTYTIEVWHETLGKLSQKVTVKPKEEVKVVFELAEKK